MTELDQFWPGCLARLEAELSSQQFNTWIKPLSAETTEEGIALFAPNRFIMQFIKDRFLARIEELAVELVGECLVELRLGAPAGRPLAAPAMAPAKAKPAPSVPAPSAPSQAKQAAVKAIGGSHESTRLNPSFTFDTLVTGKGNQLARAAAMQIAENPGDQAYNPLFVYGGVGLGKTHLIQAIGNHVFQKNPQAKIRYIHAERYVADIMRAYQHKAFDEFKRYYHSLDLLLIDDIQFFAGKNRTQEEFFYAFNALIEGGKQVIMTCDSYPKQIEGMEERLISRFSWGLTVEIQPPELEMRVAILMKKAEADSIKLDHNVAFFIAQNVRSNVRELEGALKRVVAYARFTNQNISLELVKEALKDILAAGNRQVTVDAIQKTVAEYYKIKLSDMHSKKRSRDIARPRQVAMALAKELTQLSLPNIGDAFGGRDHTTVLHACKTIAEMRGNDADIAHDYDTLLAMLRN
ncbi:MULTISPECIES: chromosomal replication initiator protein DnaA [Chromobacterium]|uniref:Chromosomal replication initiator protein DnaA n=5 Tax=Chromobacterium haemolyticum TaxID=394935 RepID=A0A1W0CLB5_9NEIS|nr:MULTISPECIES: chromosomal replication initiator protein DnaA [Chromobacterium]MBK0416126.1 chromosomal replication initiator protein DnaA [Chromobacterium haemolyticum]MBO0417322.1 chromosomal replication initiator protein DnaA [Chromobacterium haemolyticum]MBO0500543.1 chromosomal replication initiator protein DnaA [Chromobacterium haemolyticum]MDH0344451.1 chromosomal replication initiator protein DnaA [Chromobacterium haemolyticum]OQS32005.1 chromosomal replication initiation protein Dna